MPEICFVRLSSTLPAAKDGMENEHMMSVAVRNVINVFIMRTMPNEKS
jgi:hypothetical protein